MGGLLLFASWGNAGRFPCGVLYKGLVKLFGEGNGTPLQYSCLENPMDGEVWWAAVHGVAKSWTWLSDFPFTFHFHALEKEMATHSSVLAWRIPGTGELSGLPSMGSHRVRHDWSDLAAAAVKLLQPYLTELVEQANPHKWIGFMIWLWNFYPLHKSVYRCRFRFVETEYNTRRHGYFLVATFMDI